MCMDKAPLEALADLNQAMTDNTLAATMHSGIGVEGMATCIHNCMHPSYVREHFCQPNMPPQNTFDICHPKIDL